MAAKTTILCVLTGATLAVLPAAGQAQAADGGPIRRVSEGVYSAAQAARGRTTFSSICAECHTTGQFKGTPFLNNWAGRSVHALFEQIRTTMPNDDPGGLSRAEYLAVVAYFLQLNDFPAGSSSLPADDAELKRLRFDAPSDTTDLLLPHR